MNEATMTTSAGPTYGRRHPFRFLEQGSAQTLREGMAEFAAAHPDLLAPDEPELARFFYAHDACHVLFGLTTFLDDEALADVWTMLATDIPVRRYFDYLKYPELRALVVDIGVGKALWGALRAAPRMWRAWRISRRMRERWPFLGYGQHMDTPLAELRARFGVRVV